MNKLLWGVLAFLAIGVGGYGLAIVGSALAGAETHMDHHDGLRRIAFYGHFIFGPLALITGIFQFGPTAPQKRLGAHRTLGKAYVICCLTAGLAGIWMAPYSMGGMTAHLGFGGLAVAWLWTTGQAYLSARARRIPDHRAWMIRSYALTFAAVTLRLQLGLVQGPMGLSFEETYPYIAWACWVPNLIWAEWYLRRGASRPTPQAAE